MAVTFRRQESDWHGVTEKHGYSYRLLCETQWEEVAFEGAVLDEGVDTGWRIMSDVWGHRYYATVWDSEAGEPRTVTLRVVDWQMGQSDDRVRREWSHWHHSAVVDATDEVRALHAAWKDEKAEAEQLQRFEANLAEGRERATEVQKGSNVEVFKGRKVPKGTTGRVFWVGASHYGYRVGFNDDQGQTHWTALSNVRATDEDWSDSCSECGGGGWLPAYDGKGGTVSCAACERRAAERAAERVRRENERQETDEVYVGRGTKVEVVATERDDAPVGAVGEVFWRGPNRYAPGDRVGFKDSSGKTHWANVENVKVYGSNPEPKGVVAKGSTSYAVPSPSSFGAAA